MIALLSGVVAYCLAHGMRLLAYRPLGGRPSARSHRRIRRCSALATRYGVTPFEIALAWLVDLSD